MHIKIKSLRFLISLALLPLLTGTLPAQATGTPPAQAPDVSQGFDIPEENNKPVYRALSVELQYNKVQTSNNKEQTSTDYKFNSLAFDSLQCVQSFDAQGHSIPGYSEFAFVPVLIPNYTTPTNVDGYITVAEKNLLSKSETIGKNFVISLSGADLPTFTYPEVTVNPKVAVNHTINLSSTNDGGKLWVYSDTYSLTTGTPAKRNNTVRLVWPLTDGIKYYRVWAYRTRQTGETKVPEYSEKAYDVYFHRTNVGLGAFTFTPFNATDTSDNFTTTYIVEEKGGTSGVRKKIIGRVDGVNLDIASQVTSVSKVKDSENLILTLTGNFVGESATLEAYTTTDGSKKSSKNACLEIWRDILNSSSLNKQLITDLTKKASFKFALTADLIKEFGQKPVFFRLVSSKGSETTLWDSNSATYLQSLSNSSTRFVSFGVTLYQDPVRLDLDSVCKVQYKVNGLSINKSYKLRIFRSTTPGVFRSDILRLGGFEKIKEINIAANQADGSYIDSFDDNAIESGKTYFYRATLTAMDNHTAQPVLRTFDGNRIVRKDLAQGHAKSAVRVEVSQQPRSVKDRREIKNKQAFVGFAVDRALVVYEKDEKDDRNYWFADSTDVVGEQNYVTFKQLLVLLGGKTHIRLGGKFVDHFQDDFKTEYDSRKLSTKSVQAFLGTLNGGGGSFGLPSVRKNNENDEALIERLKKESDLVVKQVPTDFKINALFKWELANEPDWLVRESNYADNLNFAVDYEDFINGYKLSRTGVDKRFGFVGPSTSFHTDAAMHSWTMRFSRDVSVDELTQHYYWKSSKDHVKLSHKNLLSFDPSLHAALKSLEQTGCNFRFNESATCFSGGVEGLSNSHASALWAVNLMLLSASHGAEGINFQSGPNKDKTCYSPFYYKEISSVGSAPGLKRRVVEQINPTFYGMYAMSQALTPESPLDPVYIEKMLVNSTTSGVNVHSYARPGLLPNGTKINFDAYQITHLNSKITVLVNNEAETPISVTLSDNKQASYSLLKLTPATGCALSSTPTSIYDRSGGLMEYKSPTLINQVEKTFTVDLKSFVDGLKTRGGFLTDVSFVNNSTVIIPPGSVYFLKFPGQSSNIATNANKTLAKNGNSYELSSDSNVKFSLYAGTIDVTTDNGKTLKTNRYLQTGVPDLSNDKQKRLLAKIDTYSLLGNSGILFKGLNSKETGFLFDNYTTTLFGLVGPYSQLTGTGSAFIPNVVNVNGAKFARFELSPGVTHFLNTSLLPPTESQGSKTQAVFAGEGTVNFNSRNNLRGGIAVIGGATLKLADPTLDYFRLSATVALHNPEIRRPEFYLGDGTIVLGADDSTSGGTLDLNSWLLFNKAILVKGLGNVIKNGGLSPNAIITLAPGAELTIQNVRGAGNLIGGGRASTSGPEAKIIFKGDVELNDIHKFTGAFEDYTQTDQTYRAKSIKINGCLSTNQDLDFTRIKNISGRNAPSYNTAKIQRYSATTVVVKNRQPTSPQFISETDVVTYSGNLTDANNAVIDTRGTSFIKALISGNSIDVTLRLHGSIILNKESVTMSTEEVVLIKDDRSSYRIECGLGSDGNLLGIVYTKGSSGKLDKKFAYFDIEPIVSPNP
jgi:hypothetical protein